MRELGVQGRKLWDFCATFEKAVVVLTFLSGRDSCPFSEFLYVSETGSTYTAWTEQSWCVGAAFRVSIEQAPCSCTT